VTRSASTSTGKIPCSRSLRETTRELVEELIVRAETVLHGMRASTHKPTFTASEALPKSVFGSDMTKGAVGERLVDWQLSAVENAKPNRTAQSMGSYRASFFGGWYIVVNCIA
jgi:hypothetical protein